jgi:hypothetical protein
MTDPLAFEKADPGKCERSWWCDEPTREAFTQAAEREALRMRLSRIAHSLNTPIVGLIPLRGSR